MVNIIFFKYWPETFEHFLPKCKKYKTIYLYIMYTSDLISILY